MAHQHIALVDWRWQGHHPNYFVNYAVAIAKAGHRVLPLCSNPEDFSSRLAILLSSSSSHELNTLIDDPIHLTHPKPSKIRPARYRGLHNAWRRFVGLGKQLRNLENVKEANIDMVFFACIYDHDFECFQKVEKRFGFSWSGLYLHARSFHMPGSPMPYTGVIPRPEKIFSSRSMRSVALLDEGAVKPMNQIAGDNPVVLLPDFTDEDLPAEGVVDACLANKIMSFAQGRPVVCLLGHLQRTKGIDEFTAIAQKESMRNVFFFLGGEVNWTEIDDASRREIQKVWESAGNVFAHLQHISTDVEMNAIINISDVVYAAYRDFPNSSNILTKAAVFEKPVIVSDGYVMAERVREYGLGEVVAEGDLDEILEALNRMLASEYSDELRSRARWGDYQLVHSVDRLPECFKHLIEEQGKHT
ncbi:MAG: glycosyltransferase [Akkermansiaceae bacterium]